MISGNENCCGCGACKEVCRQDAIQWAEDMEGFGYPKVDEEKCVHCGMCDAVCQMYQKSKYHQPLEIYAFKHIDDNVRKKSASGGAFTALSDMVLCAGGSVYGVVYDEEIHAKYVCAHTKEVRNQMRDSKYVQAYPGEVLKRVADDLKEKTLVLFVGTPCQIAGLYQYLEREKVADNTLVTVDLICHGVASPKLFANFLDFCQKRRRKRIVRYYHRKKIAPWGTYVEGICYEDHKIEKDSVLVGIWKNLYLSNLILRPSCYHCGFSKKQRVADITIGDFWNGERDLGDFKDDLGVSLILLNTQKGKKLFNRTKSGIVKKCEKIPYQTSFRYSAKKPKLRSTFWEDYEKRGFPYIAQQYGQYHIKNLWKIAGERKR